MQVLWVVEEEKLLDSFNLSITMGRVSCKFSEATVAMTVKNKHL